MCPDLDFLEESIPTEIVEIAINVVRSNATMPEELALEYKCCWQKNYS